MPFGEVLGASVGGRTTGMGFSGSGDNNRKKFTGYERDTETGLDFAQARFYGSTQGRFTSPDPFSASAIIADPQTFNRFAYCRNNPVNSVDPGGMAAATGSLINMNRADGSDFSWSSKSYGSWSDNIAEDTQANNARLSNTLDTVRANMALNSGQDDLARSIMRTNPALQAVGVDGDDLTNDFVKGEPQNSAQRQPDECGPYVVGVDPNSLVGKKKKGDGECVALVQNVPNGVPNTQYWRQGERVRGNLNLAPGTVIANFDGLGRWPGLQSGNHACIYLSQEKAGIWVVDQWNGPNPTKTIIKRFIFFDDKRSDPNNGNRFFVVMTVMPDKQ
jgi:RHS repeat-associated protein